MRRRLILPLLVLALAAPAWASEEKKPDESNGLYVDLAAVGLPVIQNGRLVNYVFAQVRLVLRPGANSSALRAREPYFRDALVRAAHRTPFVIPNDPNKLDEAALKRTMQAEATRIAGRDVVGVQLTSQTPKRVLRK